MKINLATAPVSVPKKTKKALRKGYLTTLGFYGMTPTFYWNMTADEEIVGSHKLLSRANPMVLPAMIDSEYHVNDFYVRKRDIWPAYQEHEEETIYHFSDGVDQVPLHEPFINMNELVNYFYTPAFGLTTANTSGNYDIAILDTAQNTAHLDLTSLGANVLKMLNNLGYRPSWNLNDRTPVNAMALLAYMKIYLDWYFPPQYVNSLVVYNDIVRAFNNTSSDVHTLTELAIREFIQNGLGTFCFYDDDTFSIVWERPEGPASSNAQWYQLSINDGINQEVRANAGSGYTGYVDSAVTSKFTAVGLQFLQKFAGYLKRHQLAGARFVDRFLLSRGIKLEDSHRAIRLGESRIPVRVGDVESNASSTNGTEMSVLGELAGKSISWNDQQMKFKYAAQSHDGIFISITTLVANARFGTGMDRHNLHYHRDDAYMPAFDNLGVAAVRKDEVYQSMYSNWNDNPNGIFGFLPRYYEYCLSRDVLSGNFVVRNLGAQELSGYHLYRDYDVTNSLPLQSNLQMSYSFLSPNFSQMTEFNRLFYATKQIDQFIVKFDTFFDSFGPKKPLSNNYDFVGDEGHEVVSVESQGVHIQ